MNEQEQRVYDKLLHDVQYARNSFSKELLYQAHGAIMMAGDLHAIPMGKALELDAMVIRDGINNPEFIRYWNKEFAELHRHYVGREAKQ